MPYWIAMGVLSLASYLCGKAHAMRPQNPDIVIDNSAIDCNCEVCSAENKSGGLEKAKNIPEGGLPEEPDDAPSAENFQAGNEMPGIETENNRHDSEMRFVASKNGSKYYPLDCSSANRIKEENRVYYADEEEAEEDGKERASVCKE